MHGRPLGTWTLLARDIAEGESELKLREVRHCATETITRKGEIGCTAKAFRASYCIAYIYLFMRF